MDKEFPISYLFKVTNGRLKLVLVTPDGVVTDIIETSKDSDLRDYATSSLNLKKGTNKVKLVADKDTSFEYKIIIPYGNFKVLGF
ncbi:MAG: hypothetical protein ACRC7N_04580 [Clostridium sp.]